MGRWWKLSERSFCSGCVTYHIWSMYHSTVEIWIFGGWAPLLRWGCYANSHENFTSWERFRHFWHSSATKTDSFNTDFMSLSHGNLIEQGFASWSRSIELSSLGFRWGFGKVSWASLKVNPTHIEKAIVCTSQRTLELSSNLSESLPQSMVEE